MLQIDTYLCIRAVLLCTFFGKFFKLKHDLQRNSRHDLKNEWNSVSSTVPESLAYALIHLSASWSLADYLHSQNSIFFNFSSLSMVAILVCESHRQVGSSREGVRSCPLSFCRVDQSQPNTVLPRIMRSITFAYLIRLRIFCMDDEVY